MLKPTADCGRDARTDLVSVSFGAAQSLSLLPAHSSCSGEGNRPAPDPRSALVSVSVSCDISCGFWVNDTLTHPADCGLSLGPRPPTASLGTPAASHSFAGWPGVRESGRWRGVAWRDLAVLGREQGREHGRDRAANLA